VVCARRMAATAAHLVDNVLPDAPVCQWVLSYKLVYGAGWVANTVELGKRPSSGAPSARPRLGLRDTTSSRRITVKERLWDGDRHPSDSSGEAG